jgi:hypothetical protein
VDLVVQVEPIVQYLDQPDLVEDQVAHRAFKDRQEFKEYKGQVDQLVPLVLYLDQPDLRAPADYTVITFTMQAQPPD